MIPKIIHYCWFGGKPLDEKFLARAARRLAGLGYTTDVIYFVIGKLRGIKTR